MHKIILFCALNAWVLSQSDIIPSVLSIFKQNLKFSVCWFCTESSSASRLLEPVRFWFWGLRTGSKIGTGCRNRTISAQKPAIFEACKTLTSHRTKAAPSLQPGTLIANRQNRFAALAPHIISRENFLDCETTTDDFSPLLFFRVLVQVLGLST